MIFVLAGLVLLLIFYAFKFHVMIMETLRLPAWSEFWKWEIPDGSPDKRAAKALIFFSVVIVFVGVGWLLLDFYTGYPMHRHWSWKYTIGKKAWIFLIFGIDVYFRTIFAALNKDVKKNVLDHYVSQGVILMYSPWSRIYSCLIIFLIIFVVFGG